MKYAQIEDRILKAKAEVCAGLTAHVTIPLWHQSNININKKFDVPVVDLLFSIRWSLIYLNEIFNIHNRLAHVIHLQLNSEFAVCMFETNDIYSLMGSERFEVSFLMDGLIRNDEKLRMIKEIKI